MNLRYEEITKVSFEELQRALKESDGKVVSKMLINYIHNESERLLSESACIDVFNSNDVDVKATALLCLGHIARLHGELSEDVALKLLKEAKNFKELSGRLEDVISDIAVYTGKNYTAEI